MQKLLLLFSFLIISPQISYGYLYASLKGHENDLYVDGRNVHVVVAGYGAELGMSTYQMAVSRAKKLKENFPNDRVLILGSTSFHENDVNHKTTPTRLEQEYDITVASEFKKGGSSAHMITSPLTSDNFSAATLYAIADPRSVKDFYSSSGPVSLTDVSNAIRSGRIKGAGKIRSIDFITHSSPVDGIFLHNSEFYYRPISEREAATYRNRGQTVVEDQGIYYVKDRIEVSQRALTASSSQISALNGMFTDDAYVNMAGCSGGFGVVEDLSRALGVPVSGSANGAEIYVMAQNGDFYFNYKTSNPYEEVPLSNSMYAMLGHELGGNSDRSPPMSFKPATGLYNGYWGNLKQGTNFTMTACVVRDQHHNDDLARCEMGMARRIEDSVTSSNATGEKFEIHDGMSPEEKSSVATKKYKRFLNALKENMCPDGRGVYSYNERYPKVREQCFRAIDLLGVLSINCNTNAKELAEVDSAESLQSKFPERYKNACTKFAEEYIAEYKTFVPLLDREGQTLVCDLNGCKVRLKGCEVTPQERKQCWDARVKVLEETHSYASNIFLSPSCYASADAPMECLKRVLCPECNDDKKTNEAFKAEKNRYDSCLKTKRCEIDESVTQASNKDNITFMNYIQHYVSGYEKLELHRRGDLVITAPHPEVLPLRNASPSTTSRATGVQ